jgi:hypothetical protein
MSDVTLSNATLQFNTLSSIVAIYLRETEMQLHEVSFEWKFS